MKKIFLGLFACIFFLFSCNLEASFGGTDLVIPLPGSEAKIAKYDAGDVASYRVDITRNDGVHYSETGSAGGVIVFENILCGTYTVDIYALDGDTYVAARGSASIEIFKNEENYLSAEAVLQNKVTDFFVSVPKGVWNLDHARYFRGENYYNAVRDVEYGAYETETDGGNFITVTTAEIVNPEVEYAYLNLFMNNENGWISIQNNGTFIMPLNFKTEKKSQISVTVLDALREEYGYTRFYEYDPEEEGNSYITKSLNMNARNKGMQPLVRIGFSKDCGKISILHPSISEGFGNLGYLDMSVIPAEKEFVTIDPLYAKFKFSKQNSNSGYAVGLFTGMQIEKDKLYKVTIQDLQANKDVTNVRISGKSFASKRELFVSAADSLSLTADTPKTVSLLIPGILIYENDYEGAYIEIAPGEYDGDEIELKAGYISYEKVVTYPLGTFVDSVKFLITEYCDLPEYGVNSVPLKMEYDDSYIRYPFVLAPGESHYFNISMYPNSSVDTNGNFYWTQLKTGEILTDELGEEWCIPLIPLMYSKSSQLSDIDFFKTDDNRFCVKNNSSVDRVLQFTYDNCKINLDSDHSLLNESTRNYVVDRRFISGDKIIGPVGDYYKAKIATVSAEYFAQEWSQPVSKFKDLYVRNITCIPAVDVIASGLNKQVYIDVDPFKPNPKYEIVLKKKNGEIIDSKTVSDCCSEEANLGVTKYQYLIDNQYYTISQNESPTTINFTSQGKFATDNLIVEVYLLYDKSLGKRYLTVYNLSMGITVSVN